MRSLQNCARRSEQGCSAASIFVSACMDLMWRARVPNRRVCDKDRIIAFMRDGCGKNEASRTTSNLKSACFAGFHFVFVVQVFNKPCDVWFWVMFRGTGWKLTSGVKAHWSSEWIYCWSDRLLANNLKYIEHDSICRKKPFRTEC